MGNQGNGLQQVTGLIATPEKHLLFLLVSQRQTIGLAQESVSYAQTLLC